MEELDFDCTFYLGRHERSAANDEPNIIGGINPFTPVTKLGMRQGPALGRRLHGLGVKFDAVYSSRTRRTKTTAIQICHEVGMDPKKIRFSKELVERDQGDWVGRIRTETYTPEVLARMNMNVLDLAPPNGESLRQKGRSMMTWVEKEVLHNPEFIGLSKTHPLHIIVVTHGLALQCLLREILGFDAQFTWRWAIENASLTIMRYTKNGWYPVCINDTGHLVGI